MTNDEDEKRLRRLEVWRWKATYAGPICASMISLPVPWHPQQTLERALNQAQRLAEMVMAERDKIIEGEE